MLQEVMSDDILKLIESSNSVEEAFQILLVAKYDKTKVQKTNNYLDKLKLYYYQTIIELLATIDGCLSILNVQEVYCENEIEKRRKEVLLCALSDQMLLWLKSKGLNE